MSYLLVEDFRFGMDRRRSQAVGVPGTLWTLENGVITRGGDIERAKKFVPEYTLPENTHGLAALRGRPWVFGSIAPPTMPAGVQYQRLQSPYGEAMLRVLDAKAVDGKLYVIAQFLDGNVHHFLDGTLVADWDTLADSAVSANTPAAQQAVTELLADLISQDTALDAVVTGARTISVRAVEAGVPFTLSASSGKGLLSATVVQANSPEVAEVISTGSLTITGGTSSPGVNRVTSVAVGTTQLLAEPVDWVLSNEATASRIAIEINDYAHISGYTASATGATVTLSAAPGTGASPNGRGVSVATGGDVTDTTVNMAGGVTYAAPIAQEVRLTIDSSLSDVRETLIVIANDEPHRVTIATPFVATSILVHKRRLYGTAGSLLRYCQINDFDDWTTIAVPASDAGFINMANESEGAEQLGAAAPYNGFAAVFSGESIRIWTLETDAEQNAIEQVLDNTGTRSPKSAVSYGDTDVFYLDESGVRSVRARDGYDSGYVSDVGSAIDPFVQELMKAAGPIVTARAAGVVDPIDGRYMLAIGSKILCLSHFPSARINAWSYIDLGVEVSDLIRARRRVLARAGDTVYVYGGLRGDTYPDDDEFETVVETPFLSANDPAAVKMLEGFDMAVEGEWAVQVLVDPNDTSKRVDAGTLDRVNYHLPPAKLPGRTSMIALRMVCSKAGPAKVMNAAVHFSKGKAE